MPSFAHARTRGRLLSRSCSRLVKVFRTDKTKLSGSVINATVMPSVMDRMWRRFPREPTTTQAVKHLRTHAPRCDCDVKGGSVFMTSLTGSASVRSSSGQNTHSHMLTALSLRTLFSDSLSRAQGQTHTAALMSSLRDRAHGPRDCLVCASVFSPSRSQTHLHTKLHRCHAGMTSPPT